MFVLVSDKRNNAKSRSKYVYAYLLFCSILFLLYDELNYTFAKTYGHFRIVCVYFQIRR